VSLLKGEYLLCAPVAVTMTWRPHIVVCVHSTRRGEGGRPEDRPTGPDHRKLKGRPAMTAESVAAIGAEVILPRPGSPPHERPFCRCSGWDEARARTHHHIKGASLGLCRILF